MSTNREPLSRRQMFAKVFEPFRAALETAQTTSASRSTERLKVAVIQGKHCLAYKKTFCSTCYERCPEAGAIAVNQGIPQVMPQLCTGCGICHEVCPAPVNAVLMLPKKTVPK